MEAVMQWTFFFLFAALVQAAPAAASPTIEAGKIFWKNPGAPETAICLAMVIRSAQPESPSGVPFCRAFRQFQVLAVQNGWAQLGTEVWILVADLTNPHLVQPFDPRPARALRSTEIGSLTASPTDKHTFSSTHLALPVAHDHSP
jgi:hypothetical protein